MRPTPPLADRAQSRMTALVIAVTLPASAAILYLALGNPRALLADAPGINATAEHAVSRESSERMAAALAERLANEPGDLGGWIMLARTYTLLNRLPDAAAAFGRASALAPDDADLLVDYGDALAASTGGKLDGKPLELVNEALKRNPRHWKALLLAGKAAFARGQYAEASEHWEKARVALPADSPLAPAIDASIARARSARTTTGAGDAR